MIDRQIVNINEYELVAGVDRFVSAIQALARRTNTDGEPGVLRYKFYVNQEEHRAIATIVYRDADAWLEHHRLAYEWPEMEAFQATVELQRLTFLGPVNDEIHAMTAGLRVPVVRCETLATGFSRPE